MIKKIIISIILAGFLYACESSKNKKNLVKNYTCFCENDSLINHSTVSCDTTMLRNKSKLYWQFNCDRIWLTLENINKQKTIIDSLSIDFYPLTYRIGYHLIKEFDKTILFRNNCPATSGNCNFTLIDKFNGKKVKEFDHLICIETDDNIYKLDFIVYLSETKEQLIIYYVNSGKILKIPFNENLTFTVSTKEQFEEMSLKNNILELTYWSYDNSKKKISINLNDEKYSYLQP